jgi:hypothetical protein
LLLSVFDQVSCGMRRWHGVIEERAVDDIDGNGEVEMNRESGEGLVNPGVDVGANKGVEVVPSTLEGDVVLR